MSWSSRKKKEGIYLFIYFYFSIIIFCPKDIFLTFMFYLRV